MAFGFRSIGFGLLRASGLPFLIREVFQRGRVTILTLHDAEPEELDHLIRTLAGPYSFIALRDYVDAHESGRLGDLPPKPLVLVMDDGMKESRGLLDVFKAHGVKPTMFICSGIADTNRRYWWTFPMSDAEVERLKRLPDHERVRALNEAGHGCDPSDERTVLSREEIDEMRDVVDFQAHSVTHPILPRCEAGHAQAEIEDCKKELEGAFGFDIYAFAYPNGDYSDRDVGFVRDAGYHCALTQDAGFNGRHADLFRLKRVGIDKASTRSEILGRACGLPAYLKQLVVGAGSQRPYIGPVAIGNGEAYRR